MAGQGQAAAGRVDSFDVNVKDFRGNSVVIKVLPTWDVARVKQEIAQHTQVSPREFRLVFAGQSLADLANIMGGYISIAMVTVCRRFFNLV